MINDDLTALPNEELNERKRTYLTILGFAILGGLANLYFIYLDYHGGEIGMSSIISASIILTGVLYISFFLLKRVQNELRGRNA